MIKKLLMIMAVIAFVISFAYAAENASVNSTNSSIDSSENVTVNESELVVEAVELDDSSKMKVARMEFLAFTKQVEMQAAIGYIDSIGGNSSKLNSLYENLVNESASIKNSATSAEVSAGVEAMKTIVSDFKKEARKQMDANDGKTLDIALAIQDALSENENSIKTFEGVYYKMRKNNTLTIFDSRVEKAQKIIDDIEADGVNISEAQAKLDSIVSMRAVLREALEDRNDSALNAATNEIFNLSKDLQNITLSKQANSAAEARLSQIVALANRINKAVKTAANELEDAEMNVSSLKELNSELDDNSEAIEDALKEDNMEDAGRAVIELKASIALASSSIKEFAGKRSLAKELKTKLQAMNAVLDKVAAGI